VALVLGGAGLGVGGLGCATTTTEPTNRSWTLAEASVRAADQMGAQNVPHAAVPLQMAHRELERARALIDVGDDDRAMYVLARARVDAELSIALLREQETRGEAQRAMEQLKTIQSGRGQGGENQP
jgi:hypothetical protein